VIICAPLAALGVAFAARPGRGTIALDLTFSRPVTLEVTWVSALGRMIRRHTASPESEHHVVWDGRDSNGRSSASGVYWVRLHAHAENGESWRAERKALLLR
jgi:flagellar hook assembly protein FlgD